MLKVDDLSRDVLDPALGFRNSGLDASRRYLVSITATAPGTVTAVAQDRAGGQRLGRLDTVALPSPDETMLLRLAGDTYRVLSRTAGVWRLNRYRLPAFDPESTIILPSSLGGSNGGSTATATATEPTDRGQVVAMSDGLISSFDPRTGEPIGPPVDLSPDLDHRSDYGSSIFRLRPGRPDQVAVLCPDRVELWSLTERRRLSSLSTSVLAVVNPSSVAFDPSGGRLAVLTSGHGIELWDLDPAPDLRLSLPAPDTEGLAGFTADGQLVATSSSDPTRSEVQLWDIDAGRVAATLAIPLDVALDDVLDTTRTSYTVNADLGMPYELPLSAQVWADHLCAAVGGSLTDAERAALPPGVEATEACPGS